MFHVVQFSDGIAVTCEKWMDKEKKNCYLPPSEISKHVKRLSEPANTWNVFDYENIILSNDNLDYVKYRAYRYETKGTISDTDLEKPRPKMTIERFRQESNRIDTPAKTPPKKKRIVITAYNAADKTPSCEEETIESISNTSSDEQDTTISSLGNKCSSVKLRGQDHHLGEPLLGHAGCLPDGPSTAKIVKEVCGESTTKSEILTKLLCANYILTKENNLMLRHLTARRQESLKRYEIPTSLPCKTLTACEELNDYLKDEDNRHGIAGYFGVLDTFSVRRTTYNVMSKIFTLDIASGINWLGKQDKVSLKNSFANIFLLVRLIVQNHHDKSSETDVVDGIQRWLKKAPNALKKTKQV